MSYLLQYLERSEHFLKRYLVLVHFLCICYGGWLLNVFMFVDKILYSSGCWTVIVVPVIWFSTLSQCSQQIPWSKEGLITCVFIYMDLWYSKEPDRLIDSLANTPSLVELYYVRGCVGQCWPTKADNLGFNISSLSLKDLLGLPWKPELWTRMISVWK